MDYILIIDKKNTRNIKNLLESEAMAKLKYFSYKTTEEDFSSTLKKFGIYQQNFTFPKNLNPYSLASYVFENCKKLFPENFLALLESDKEWYSFFRKDIIKHLIFSTKVSNEMTSSYIDNQSQYLVDVANKSQSMYEEIEPSTETDSESTISEPKNATDLQKQFRDKVAIYLNLPKIDYKKQRNRNEKIYDIPTNLAFFISFITYNTNSHRAFVRKMTSQIQTQDMAKYQKVFSMLTDNMSNEERFLNHYLFEREYNINLIESIMNINDSEFIDHTNGKKVLSLLSLLPNIEGRTLLTKVFTKYIGVTSPINHSNNFGNITLEKTHGKSKKSEHVKNHSRRINEAKWFVETPSIILQLALISIPIMESTYNFLYNALALEEKSMESPYYKQPKFNQELTTSLLPIDEDDKLKKFNDLKNAMLNANNLISSDSFIKKIEQVSPTYSDTVLFNIEDREIKHNSIYLEPLIHVAFMELMQTLEIPI